MKKITVTPGYYEWHVCVDNQIVWTDGDPSECLFGDDAYTIEEYADLITSFHRYMQTGQEKVDTDSINWELLNTLTTDDFDVIKQEYAKALKQTYDIGSNEEN